jgi:hypothetical protein
MVLLDPVPAKSTAIPAIGRQLRKRCDANQYKLILTHHFPVPPPPQATVPSDVKTPLHFLPLGETI